jgi:hypothetical protein
LFALRAPVGNILLDSNEVLIGGIANPWVMGAYMDSLGRFVKRGENGIFE